MSNKKQPVLPLEAEADLAIRQLRFIAILVGAPHASALRDLADGLERSRNHTSGIQR